MWGQFEDIEGDEPKQSKAKETTKVAAVGGVTGVGAQSKAVAALKEEDGSGGDGKVGATQGDKRTTSSSATVNKQLLNVLSSSSLEFSPR